jgi:hypothetical protein
MLACVSAQRNRGSPEREQVETQAGTRAIQEKVPLVEFVKL